jgi:hypothetical protein
VDFLTRANQVFPTARRLALTDLGDRASQEGILEALVLGRIDYYEPKPGRPPTSASTR